MLLNCVIFLGFSLSFNLFQSLLTNPTVLAVLPRMGIYEIRHSNEGTLPTLLFSETTKSCAESFSASLPHIVLGGISCLHIPL